MRAMIAVVCGAALALVLGCSNSSSGPSMTPVSFAGTAVDSATGAPVTSAAVAVAQNGVPVTSVTTGATDGTFTVANLPTGTGYAVEITKAGSEYVPTLYAPLTLNTDISGRFLEIFTQSELLALMPTLTPPAAGTSTLLVYGINGAGALVPVSVVVGSLPASPSNIPAVVTAIVPGAYTLTVTDSAGSVTIPNVQLTPDVFTVVNATVP